MVELTKVYGQLAFTYCDYIGVGLLTAAIYFLMGLPLVRLPRWVEAPTSIGAPATRSAGRSWFGAQAVP